MLRLSLTGTSVLIVEDNWFVATNLEALCRDAGADVVGPAATVADALIHIAEQRIDVAILDFRLQDEVASAVADRLTMRAVPFFFYTGSPEAALAYPDARILNKPCSEAVLIKALKTTAAERHR
jgi:two-component system, response regulator PdtaR